jgi:hypothetical protein
VAVFHHAELDTYFESPEGSRAMLAHSGWRMLSDEEAEKYLADQRAAELSVEEELSAQAIVDPSVAQDASLAQESEPTDGESTTRTEKENG